MKIFFPVLNWGLGHASRSLPLIRTYLKDGHEVIVASDGEALSMLRKELPDQKVLQLPGYGIHYSSKYMPFNMLRYGPGMLRTMKTENELTAAIAKREKLDCIISDNRYGCYHPEVPSALITHQLQVFTGQKLLDIYIRRQIRGWCRKFSEIWIPDQIPPENITGDLSGVDTSPVPKYYLGIISELKSKPTKNQYDAVAVISGPEPQRSHFEEIVINQLSSIPGEYAVVCGQPGTSDTIRAEKNITIIPYLTRAQLSGLLDKTEVVISRSGYTTLMDLARTGHKAILCPTPGQYEQIYLADRLATFGQCIYKRQENIDLENALEEVKKIKPVGHDLTGMNEDFIFRLEHLAKHMTVPSAETVMINDENH